MKFKFILSLLILLFSQVGIAGLPPKPEQCPDVKILGESHIDQMYTDPSGKWVGVTLNNNFGTKDKWAFIISAGEAATKEQALENIKNSLASLMFVSGPSPDLYFEFWVCEYRSHIGVAHTYTMPVTK